MRYEPLMCTLLCTCLFITLIETTALRKEKDQRRIILIRFFGESINLQLYNTFFEFLPIKIFVILNVL